MDSGCADTLPSSEPVRGTRLADHAVRRSEPPAREPIGLVRGGRTRYATRTRRSAARLAAQASGLDDGPEPLAHDQAHQLLHVPAATVRRIGFASMWTWSCPGTTAASARPSSTESHTSRSSRSRSDATAASSRRQIARPPRRGVRIATTVTNRVWRASWSESVPGGRSGPRARTRARSPRRPQWRPRSASSTRLDSVFTATPSPIVHQPRPPAPGAKNEKAFRGSPWKAFDGGRCVSDL